ncbi:hypothetical protein, partial [Nostoc sp. NZL]|uniref:hypothetical protein n=1 Tax=Nostoc sp. NZL TaxID=2650612 RepID=UPI001E314266
AGELGTRGENLKQVFPLVPNSPCPPCLPCLPHPSSPGNSKSPEQLSIMFPTQASGLSILDKFKQPQSFGCMLHPH